MPPIPPKKPTGVPTASNRKVTDFFPSSSGRSQSSSQSQSSSAKVSDFLARSHVTKNQSPSQSSSSQPGSSQGKSSQTLDTKKGASATIASPGYQSLPKSAAGHTFSTGVTSDDPRPPSPTKPLPVYKQASSSTIRAGEALPKTSLKRPHSSITDLTNKTSTTNYDSDVIVISTSEDSPVPTSRSALPLKNREKVVHVIADSDSDVVEIKPPPARPKPVGSTLPPSKFYRSSQSGSSSNIKREPSRSFSSILRTASSSSLKQSYVPSRPTSPRKSHSPAKNGSPERSRNSMSPRKLFAKSIPDQSVRPFKKLRLSDEDEIPSSQDDEREISRLTRVPPTSEETSATEVDIAGADSMDWVPSPFEKSFRDGVSKSNFASISTSISTNATSSPSPFTKSPLTGDSSRMMSEAEVSAFLPIVANSSAFKKLDAEVGHVSDKTLVSDLSTGATIDCSRGSVEEASLVVLPPGWDQDDSDDLGLDLDKELGLKKGASKTGGLLKEEDVRSSSPLTEESDPSSRNRRALPYRAPSSPTPPPEDTYRRRSTRPVQPPKKFKSTVVARAPIQKEFCALDALLKEKKRKEKKFGGADVFKEADEVVKRAMEAGSSDRSSVSPRKMLRTPRKTRNSSFSPGQDSDISDSEDSSFDVEEDAKDLLSDDDDVLEILKRDRDAKKQRSAVGKSKSVRFWEKATESGTVNVVPLPTIASATHPYVKRLQTSASRKDVGQLKLLLNPTQLRAVKPGEEKRALCPWLLEIATLQSDVFLAGAAQKCLTSILQSESTARDILTFEFVLSLIARLGAKSESLELLEGGAKKCDYTGRKVQRNEGLYRLAAVFNSSEKFNVMLWQDLPGLVLSFLFIAMDPYCYPELKRAIISAVQTIVECPDTPLGAETAVLEFVSKKCSSFSTRQKRSLINLIPACGPKSTRLSAWIALGLLDVAETQSLDENVYLGPPPIESLLPLLAKKEALFDVSQATADFDALTDNVEILSVMLKDVEPYIAASKAQGKPDLIADVCKALEEMHGSIIDTRAAHMDRTRAKESIQRLEKRLHYQRKRVLEKKVTLKSYFSK